MPKKPPTRKQQSNLIAFRQPDPVKRENYRRAAVRRGIHLSAWIRLTLDCQARKRVA